MKQRTPYRRRPRRGAQRRRHLHNGGGRAGFALLMAMITVAILAVLVTEFHSSTGTAFAAANMQRDRLKAEYLARSGVNLTRMLMSQERNLRRLVEPMYKLVTGAPRAPQIPVWEFADFMLKPFMDYEGSQESMGEAGYDLGLAEGLGDLGGTFEVIGSAENTKLNVNRHLTNTDEYIRNRIARELYGRFEGHIPESRYSPLFGELDEDGRMVTRLDLISNLIDWWDYDQTRHQYDWGAKEVVPAGSEENDLYQSQRPPYDVKNAPYDTYEEMHLIQGVTDDIWATFIDPDPNDPRQRQFTIYGGGAVNPNGSDPLVTLAALCDVDMNELPLCSVPAEMLKFAAVLRTIQAFTMGAPLFSSSDDFVDFMEGKGQLYAMAQMASGANSELMFTPVAIPQGPPPNRAPWASCTTFASIKEPPTWPTF